MTTESTTDILTLEGTGYKLSVAPETEAEKLALLSASSGITEVATPEDSHNAQRHIRGLAAFRIQVEKARTEVKKPVLELGRKIDAAAGEFVAAVTCEEDRLKKLVGSHAEVVARQKREAEAEERRKLDEAKRAREAAEQAAREAEEARERATKAKSIAEVLAARQTASAAEQSAKAAAEQASSATADQRQASALVATTRINDGVRMVDDFEVTDIDALYKLNPLLVELTPRTAAIKKLIAATREEGLDPASIPGIRVFQKPVVSTR